MISNNRKLIFRPEYDNESENKNCSGFIAAGRLTSVTHILQKCIWDAITDAKQQPIIFSNIFSLY